MPKFAVRPLSPLCPTTCTAAALRATYTSPFQMHAWDQRTETQKTKTCTIHFTSRASSSFSLPEPHCAAHCLLWIGFC
ncbi:hypothetical protein DFH09DRAFT_1193458 [Mycena vulgaris]|nr:hypothetical protein DFH09DRAFT_1193458 [Mycena vulgaris]